MTNPAVHCQALYKTFTKNQPPVVHNLTISVPQSAIIALLGPSGCGKTTTLRLIAGLEQLDTGQISIANHIVANEHKHIPIEKRRIGMVFQDYAIFPHLSVAQNVGFGLRRQDRAQRVPQMLNFVGLKNLGHRMPHELSGGQQQRVALARALAPAPSVLLLDEPFSNLDAALRLEMRAEVRQLLQEANITAIFVTHDQEEALFMGDQVAIMNHGRLEQIGTPEELFHHPQTRFVAQFLGQTDFLPATVTTAGLETPLGTYPTPPATTTGDQLEIPLRADDILLKPHTTGNAEIIERQFIGIAYIYHIRLPNNLILRSWQPHTTTWPVGLRVQATLTDTQPFVYFPTPIA